MNKLLFIMITTIICFSCKQQNEQETSTTENKPSTQTMLNIN